MKRKRKKFNWLTVLRKCAKHKPSEEIYKWLKLKAGNWPTCACGQLCKRLPRNSDKAPDDYRLRKLGYAFCNRVERCKWKAALRTFISIEKRTAQLLAKP